MMGYQKEVVLSGVDKTALKSGDDKTAYNNRKNYARSFGFKIEERSCGFTFSLSSAKSSHYHLPRVLIDNYQCASFVVYKVIHKWISCGQE